MWSASPQLQNTSVLVQNYVSTKHTEEKKKAVQKNKCKAETEEPALQPLTEAGARSTHILWARTPRVMLLRTELCFLPAKQY